MGERPAAIIPQVSRAIESGGATHGHNDEEKQRGESIDFKDPGSAGYSRMNSNSACFTASQNVDGRDRDQNASAAQEPAVQSFTEITARRERG